MTPRAYRLAFGLLAALTVVSLMTAAYEYGKKNADAPAESADAAPKTKVLLGTVTHIEPLHIYIESESFGPSRTYDVLVSPQTRFLQLEPWAPGEREKAVDEYSAYIAQLKPKAGDPVLPPPPKLKPEPLDLSTLTKGTQVGVLSVGEIDPSKPLVAATIRPLTPQEIAAGSVENSFPL